MLLESLARTRRLRLALLLVLGVLLLGTLGYMQLEQLTLVDALYTTISVMTTVGNVVHPLSDAGRTFTILVMVLGIACVLYAFGVVMEYVIEGHLSSTIRRRRMKQKIMALREHTIVCGFGRVGSQIAADLRTVQVPFVVIDDKERSAENAMQNGYLTLQADATTDAALIAAGVGFAKCLLAATDEDSRNISITLSARHLSPALFIVARANHPETDVKLKLAGADQVLSPYTIAGHRMANLALRPGVVEFFQSIARVGNTELVIEEVLLSSNSPLIGRAMTDAPKIVTDGAILVALKKGSRLVPGLRPDVVIERGDTALVVGTPEQLVSFARGNGHAVPPPLAIP